MKKNKTVEVTVCDVCGKDGKPFPMEKCMCGKNVCDGCCLVLECSYIICRTHIDPEILKKLGGE